MLTLTFHGHACFTLEAHGGARQFPFGVRAVEFVQPRAVIPMHYNTWDVIQADPEHFKRQVGGRARVVVLAPGDAHTLS